MSSLITLSFLQDFSWSVSKGQAYFEVSLLVLQFSVSHSRSSVTNIRRKKTVTTLTRVRQQPTTETRGFERYAILANATYPTGQLKLIYAARIVVQKGEKEISDYAEFWPREMQSPCRDL